jgi:4-hydroxy-tetrahydrodipicolinate reductase
MEARPLKLALVGYGRMGRAVEAAAVARGHRVISRIDPAAPGATHSALGPAALDGVELALEFTAGPSAPTTVAALLDAGTPVVSGSTGWTERTAELRALAAARRVGFLWAPNFSFGVHVLFRLVDAAAGWFGALAGFAPFVLEEHHQAKKDAPSGTARRLAEIIVRRSPGKSRYGLAPADGALPTDLVPVAWIRAGAIPGVHTVGWDGGGETVRIIHEVRDRSVFAEGAVRAAEWLRGRSGPATLDEMLDELLPALRRDAGETV